MRENNLRMVCARCDACFGIGMANRAVKLYRMVVCSVENRKLFLHRFILSILSNYVRKDKI